MNARSPKPWLAATIIPAALSTVSASACWAACRAGSQAELQNSGLGIFLGGVLLVALMVPAVVAAQSAFVAQLLSLTAALLPWWICWTWLAVMTIPSTAAASHFFECIIAIGLVTAFAGALAGLIALLIAARLPRGLAAAIITVLAIAWITWPIWTSPRWGGVESQERVERFLNINPAVAINGQVFKDFGSWTEQSVAYHLTELNQSVPYTFPASAWPAGLWHLVLACVAFGGAWAVGLLTTKDRAVPQAVPFPMPSKSETSNC